MTFSRTYGRYNPYTGEYFLNSLLGGSPDHILDVHEALSSGLCDAPASTLGMFGRDIFNLTLVSPGAADQNRK